MGCKGTSTRPVLYTLKIIQACIAPVKPIRQKNPILKNAPTSKKKEIFLWIIFIFMGLVQRIEGPVKHIL